jgi:hypothetical protein
VTATRARCLFIIPSACARRANLVAWFVSLIRYGAQIFPEDDLSRHTKRRTLIAAPFAAAAFASSNCVVLVAGECARASRRPLRPALSRLCCRSPVQLWEPARSRAGTPIGSRDKAGERGARRKAAPTRATLRPGPSSNPEASAGRVLGKGARSRPGRPFATPSASAAASGPPRRGWA